MRWDDFRRSDNIEDDRGAGGGFGGGGSGIQFGGGGLGIGTVIVLGLLGWALGIDPSVLIGGAELINGGSQYQQQSRPANRRVGTPSDATGQFVAAVLGNTEDTWGEIFQRRRSAIRPAAAAPIYTAANKAAAVSRRPRWGRSIARPTGAFISTRHFSARSRHAFMVANGNACKFSQAYVIAHEVGHHVQNLLGTLAKANAAQRAAGGQAAANRIQVRVELQADCFAGVWAHHSDQRKKFPRSR